MCKRPFDFNGDGKMDAFERAAEFAFLNDLLNDDHNEDTDAFDDSDLDSDTDAGCED